MYLSQDFTTLTTSLQREGKKVKREKKNKRKKEKEKKRKEKEGGTQTPNPYTSKISHSLLQLPQSKDGSVCASTVQYCLITDSEIPN